MFTQSRTIAIPLFHIFRAPFKVCVDWPGRLAHVIPSTCTRNLLNNILILPFTVQLFHLGDMVSQCNIGSKHYSYFQFVIYYSFSSDIYFMYTMRSDTIGFFLSSLPHKPSNSTVLKAPFITSFVSPLETITLVFLILV